jgi:F-type H+-transporting ATPase subunit b
MAQILSTFGIDWRLLLINAINFALALGVLWYFLYTPLMRILEERRQKVSQGVRDAEQARAKLEEVEANKASQLALAGKEADAILSGARSAGAQKERELIAQGEAAAQSILSEAQRQAQELKAQALEESKQEIAKLIVLGMERAFHKQK